MARVMARRMMMTSAGRAAAEDHPKTPNKPLLAFGEDKPQQPRRVPSFSEGGTGKKMVSLHSFTGGSPAGGAADRPLHPRGPSQYTGAKNPHEPVQPGLHARRRSVADLESSSQEFQAAQSESRRRYPARHKPAALHRGALQHSAAKLGIPSDALEQAALQQSKRMTSALLQLDPAQAHDLTPRASETAPDGAGRRGSAPGGSSTLLQKFQEIAIRARRQSRREVEVDGSTATATAGNKEDMQVQWHAYMVIRRFLLRMSRFKRRIKEKERSIAGKKLAEICCYLLFLLFFSLSTIVVAQDQAVLHQGNQIRRELNKEYTPYPGAEPTRLEDIVTTVEMFAWLQGPFLNTFYGPPNDLLESVDDSWGATLAPNYTCLADADAAASMNPGEGDDLTGVSESGAFTTQCPGQTFNALASSLESRPGLVFGTSKVVGGIRVAQLRVTDEGGSCVDTYGFRLGNIDRAPPCVGDNGGWSSDYESTASFGLLNTTVYRYPPGEPPFRYAGVAENQSLLGVSVREERNIPINGLRTTATNSFYPTPAYPVILPNNGAEEAQRLLRWMQEARYFDEQTKVLSVHTTLYNAQLDYFTIVAIHFEQPKSGGVLPSLDWTTTRLFTYFDSRDVEFRVAEGIVAVFYVYFFLQEIAKVWVQGLDHLLSFSAVFHNLNIIIYLGVWAFRFLSVQAAPDESTIIMDSNTYYEFRSSANLKQVSVLLNSLNAFLAWFKLIRYLSLIPVFALITGTLAKSAGPVFSFIFVFMIVVGGFSAAHLLAFGTKLESFKNLTTSAFSLLQSLLGDFNFVEMRKAQWFLAPTLFVSFVAISAFFLLNLLIATVAEAYGEMQEQLRNDPNSQTQGKRIYEYVLELISSFPGMECCLTSCSTTWRRMQRDRANAALRCMYQDTAGRALALSRVVDAMGSKGAAAYGSNGSSAELPQSKSGGNGGATVVPTAGGDASGMAGGSLLVGTSGSPREHPGEVEASDIARQHSKTSRALQAAAMGLGSFMAIGRNAASTMDVTDEGLNHVASIKSMKVPSHRLKQGERENSSSDGLEHSTSSSAGARRWAKVQSDMAVQPSFAQSCGDILLRFLQADPELEKHEDDPEQVGGPFQSSVARTINTRVFLKRRLLGARLYDQVQADRLRLAELDFLKRSDWYRFASKKLELEAPRMPEYLGMLQYAEDGMEGGVGSPGDRDVAATTDKGSNGVTNESSDLDGSAVHLAGAVDLEAGNLKQSASTAARGDVTVIKPGIMASKRPEPGSKSAVLPTAGLGSSVQGSMDTGATERLISRADPTDEISGEVASIAKRRGVRAPSVDVPGGESKRLQGSDEKETAQATMQSEADGSLEPGPIDVHEAARTTPRKTGISHAGTAAGNQSPDDGEMVLEDMSQTSEASHASRGIPALGDMPDALRSDTDQTSARFGAPLLSARQQSQVESGGERMLSVVVLERDPASGTAIPIGWAPLPRHGGRIELPEQAGARDQEGGNGVVVVPIPVFMGGQAAGSGHVRQPRRSISVDRRGSRNHNIMSLLQTPISKGGMPFRSPTVGRQQSGGGKERRSSALRRGTGAVASPSGAARRRPSRVGGGIIGPSKMSHTEAGSGFLSAREEEIHQDLLGRPPSGHRRPSGHIAVGRTRRPSITPHPPKAPPPPPPRESGGAEASPGEADDEK